MLRFVVVHHGGNDSLNQRTVQYFFSNGKSRSEEQFFRSAGQLADSIHGSVGNVVRRYVARPGQAVEKIKQQIFMVAPDEDDLALLHQIQDKCLQLPSFSTAIKQVTADNQLMGLIISEELLLL